MLLNCSLYKRVIIAHIPYPTRVETNNSKSSMIPINTPNDKCQELANIFGCKVEILPFTYLGLPLGTTMRRIEHFVGSIEKIDKRCLTLQLLSYDGRLIVVNSMITSMHSYATCVPLNCPRDS